MRLDIEGRRGDYVQIRSYTESAGERVLKFEILQPEV